MSVGDETWDVVVWFRRRVGGAAAREDGRQGEEVAGAGGSVRDEREYLGDQSLLYTCVQLGVEFGKPGLA